MDVLGRLHGERFVEELLRGALRLACAARAVASPSRLATPSPVSRHIATRAHHHQHKNAHDAHRALVRSRTKEAESAERKPKRQRILEGFVAAETTSLVRARTLLSPLRHGTPSAALGLALIPAAVL